MPDTYPGHTNMNKIFAILRFTVVICLGTLMFSSCKDKDTTIDVSKIVAERDSLAAINSHQQQELDNLNMCISTISNGLDSITAQEEMIRFSSSEGTGMSPNDLKKSFQDLGELIARQRLKISALEDSLKNSSSQAPELQKMISFLNSQLEVKENQIAQLRAQVNSQKRDITALRNYIAVADQKVAEVENDNSIQKEIIQAQDKQINTGYIRIGTQKELKNAGLLSKRILSSPKLIPENLSPSVCQSVDIRQFNEVTLHSKNPKILTSMPKNSYTLEKTEDGNSRILVITDVAFFWSQSNYLVIAL